MARSSTSLEPAESSLLGTCSQLWRATWTRWVGWRYLKSKKSSQFLSFITVLSVAGVALGVATMIVVLSVMDGFEDELKKRLINTDMHVLVTPTVEVPGFEGGFVSAKEDAAKAVLAAVADDPGIESVHAIVSTEAILRTGKKVAGVVLKGASRAHMERVKKLVTETAQPELLIDREGGHEVKLPEIWVGQELAYEFSIIPGDQVTIVSPTETQGPLESVPRMQRFVVAGLYQSGVPEQELHVVFCADQSVRSFLRRSDAISSWEIVARQFDDAPRISERLSRLLPQFKSKNWIELNASLFASLKLERVAMFVALAFIVVVACFNIVTILTLMIVEKKREISIMRAMGARQSHIAAIFLGEGLLIGMLGVTIGMILALIICVFLRKYGLVALPEIYYDRTLPVAFNLSYYVLVAVCAFFIVLMSAMFPSRRASRIHPLEGIRQG